MKGKKKDDRERTCNRPQMSEQTYKCDMLLLGKERTRTTALLNGRIIWRENTSHPFSNVQKPQLTGNVIPNAIRYTFNRFLGIIFVEMK